jgi:hypothetical protein
MDDDLLTRALRARGPIDLSDPPGVPTGRGTYMVPAIPPRAYAAAEAEHALRASLARIGAVIAAMWANRMLCDDSLGITMLLETLEEADLRLLGMDR